MAKKTTVKKTGNQGILFEEDYLIRTLGALGTSPEVALTELVANAWDAGATIVNISIPDKIGAKLIIDDNGVGLTKDQFYNRWMKLGYNRLKHQGKNVIFPKGVDGKRFAYGRNGVGRHGLLCFNNEYKVTTCTDKGDKSEFVITTVNDVQPFIIKSSNFSKGRKTGTKLEVVVNKNLPKQDKILEIISARFLHDPNFIVSINRVTVPLESLTGLIASEKMKVGNIELVMHFIDSSKAAKSSIYQGIAFWQAGRLVGEPSWTLGRQYILDGRTSYAKRYTVVVESQDLAEFIFEDWSGFKKVDVMEEIYKEVGIKVNEMFAKIAKENIADTKQQVKDDFGERYKSLSPLAKYEVDEIVEKITESHPTAKQESITMVVEAVIHLEKSRHGKDLLIKLSTLTEEDIIGLNTLLEKWSVKDALTVLDEIDNRLAVIEAIRTLSPDETVDELNILHPLVTAARWIFGPEFESAEYASNRQLHTAIEKVFNKKIDKTLFNNHKKRPDIVVIPNSTLSVTATDGFDNDSGLAVVNRVLIIELKRGGSKLGKDERNQAQGYVEEFMNCGSLLGNPYFDAFVVGKTFSEKVQPISTVINNNNVEMGKIRISTFSQLVDTAEKRLFGLRQKLASRYDDVPGMELYKQKEIQLKADLAN
jgi:hypothetical protein